MKTIQVASDSKTRLNQVPKVSIGLAVFNGEKYLKEAIDSILAQTFTGFELIISDNASSDRTAEICKEYAARDSRIRYYRNATNIGGANNENRTFELSRGEYFRWAAHDDVCAPELLAKCVEILDREPSVVLCYSDIVKIDEHGREFKRLAQDKGCSTDCCERFCDLASGDHLCETTYGLIRANVLRQTELQPNYSDSDRTLLCELSLHGQFYRIPEPLFYQRDHPEKSTIVYPTHQQRMLWFYPNIQKDYSFGFILSRQFTHYLRIISRAPITFDQRMRCYLYLGKWLFVHRRYLSMLKELLLSPGQKFLLRFVQKKPIC
jgi:glycosyltransferase involved in cell wall biosynthesis